MKVALFFGSFNPIHNGHIAIAGYVSEFCNVNEVWLVVSPQNPLKEQRVLANDKQRLTMVKKAIKPYAPKIRVCDVEFRMPKPSYTIDTLKHLPKLYPNIEFVVVMGADSLKSISQWKDYKELLSNYRIIVYPRPNINMLDLQKEFRIEIANAPLFDISSTELRNWIAEEKDVRCFMPIEAYRYIVKQNLYRSN
jgi:nicotinate-nucleotide adenylyltransferase